MARVPCHDLPSFVYTPDMTKRGTSRDYLVSAAPVAWNQESNNTILNNTFLPFSLVVLASQRGCFRGQGDVFSSFVLVPVGNPGG